MTQPLLSDPGTMAYVGDLFWSPGGGLVAAWTLGQMGPGLETTRGFDVLWSYCGADEYMSTFTCIAQFSGSRFPIWRRRAVRITQNEPLLRTLQISGISPAEISPSPVQTPLIIRGNDFYDGVRVVFHSGTERIEIPPQQLTVVSSTEIHTTVAFPDGFPVWTVYAVAPGRQVSQLVFFVKQPIQLINPAVTSSKQFTCWFEGAAGHAVSVEFSLDLLAWHELTNFTSTGQPALISDLTSNNATQRFYRGLRKD